MRIELSSTASKQLRKLKRHKEMYQRVNAALDEIAENPYSGKHMDSEFAGVRSKRVGDWRILYEIMGEIAVVVVIRIADRKEVYRSR